MLHYPLQAYIHLAVPPVHDNGHSKMFNKQNNPLNRWYRAQSSLLNIDWCSPKLKVSNGQFSMIKTFHWHLTVFFLKFPDISKCNRQVVTLGSARLVIASSAVHTPIICSINLSIIYGRASPAVKPTSETISQTIWLLLHIHRHFEPFAATENVK